MFRKISAFISAAAISAACLSITAFADGGIYIGTSPVPEEVTQYAQEKFSTFSAEGFEVFGLSAKDAREVSLCNGYIMKNIDGSNIEGVYHFPIISRGRFVLMMNVSSLDDGSYHMSMGQNYICRSLNNFETSEEDPLVIYVSDDGSAAYGVTDSGVTIINEVSTQNVTAVESDIEQLENIARDTENVIFCGEKKITVTKKNGKIYGIDPSGNYLSGWCTIDGNKYYFKKNGQAVTTNAVIGNVYYKFGSDGICKGTYTGWKNRSGNYYYYKDGIMKKNCWLTVGGKRTYYLDSNGIRVTGNVTINGAEYKFDKNGMIIS